jgi:hypothetical protein
MALSSLPCIGSFGHCHHFAISKAPELYPCRDYTIKGCPFPKSFVSVDRSSSIHKSIRRRQYNVVIAFLCHNEVQLTHVAVLCWYRVETSCQDPSAALAHKASILAMCCRSSNSHDPTCWLQSRGAYALRLVDMFLFSKRGRRRLYIWCRDVLTNQHVTVSSHNLQPSLQPMPRSL